MVAPPNMGMDTGMVPSTVAEPRSGGGSSALELALPVLRCPVCRGGLRLAESSARCEAGHSFDVARQGYLNLAAGRPLPKTGDTADMVAARDRFLGGGHYGPIEAGLAAVLRGAAVEANNHMVDLAGGTGHYLARLLDTLPAWHGVNVDISKFALRRAARSHDRVAAVAADAWGDLPFRDGAVGAILSVFGPRNIPEIQRILRPGGWFVVVTPTGEHLRELIEPLGLLRVDGRKQRRLDEQLTGFEPVTEARMVDYSAALAHDDIEQLVSMGPSARHLTPSDVVHRVGELPETQPVTISVRVAAYRCP